MSAPSLPQLLVGHWEFSFTVTAAVLASAVLYAAGARRATGGWAWPRTIAFLAGLATVLVVLESGIGTYDDALLSVHMVQHMLLLLLAPLFLLLGQPVRLALRALPSSHRPRAVAVLRRARRWTGPLACLAVFTGIVLATHLSAFYDATVRHPFLHEAEHGAYLGAGLLLWWPLIGADPSPAHRLGGLGRLVYMLAAMPGMALVGAYLDRATSVVYVPYGPAARALGVSAVVDQQHAGAIMWVSGTLIVAAVGLWAFGAALVDEERRLRVREAADDRRAQRERPAASEAWPVDLREGVS